jgi:hypothetical protein
MPNIAMFFNSGHSPTDNIQIKHSHDLQSPHRGLGQACSQLVLCKYI